MIRGYRRSQRLEEGLEAHRQFERRSVRWWVDEEGYVRISARLPADDGALVVAQLDVWPSPAARTRAMLPRRHRPPAYPRKRRGASGATEQWSRCSRTSWGGQSASDDRLARSPGGCAARCNAWLAAAAGSPGAARGASSRTTSGTGPTADPQTWTTWFCCVASNRLVHEVGYAIRVHGPGDFTFLRPDGSAVPAHIEPATGTPEAVEETNRRLDLNTTEHDRHPRLDGDPPDYDWAIQVLHHVSAETPPSAQPAVP